MPLLWTHNGKTRHPKTVLEVGFYNTNHQLRDFTQGLVESTMKRVSIRLAEIPEFAREEYHPNQVAFYSKFTELTFRALNLPSVAEFMDKLAETLNLQTVEVRVLRMPSSRRSANLVQKEGKTHLVIEYRKGLFRRRRSLIDIYPDLLWASRLTEPRERAGIRGFVLNASIRALIHEMLHQSGVHDETEAKRQADQHYKEFRRTHLSRFEQEFKPILQEWKKAEKEMGLR